eukprot:gene7263-14808_t
MALACVWSVSRHLQPYMPIGILRLQLFPACIFFRHCVQNVSQFYHFHLDILFPTFGNRDHLFISWMMYLYPLSFFYYFLYYTDTISTVSIAACYLASLSCPHRVENTKIPTWSGVARWLLLLSTASAAILSRQTNAVWVLFIAGERVLFLLKSQKLFVDGPLSLDLLTRLSHSLSMFRFPLLTVLGDVSPLLLPVAAFALFVAINGSVVLGDKANHQPTLHPAMLLHQTVAMAFMLGPIAVMREIRAVMRGKWSLSTAIVTSVTLVGILLVLYYGTLHFLSVEIFPVEEDIEVDTTLLNNLILVIPLILAPVYLLCGKALCSQLSRTRGIIWTCGLFVACAITLLPTPLLEPRYFTPGVIFAVLNFPQVGVGEGWDVLLLCTVLNAVVMAVFLFLPFRWGDGTEARFMF